LSEAISDSLNGPHSREKVGFAGREAFAAKTEGFCAIFEFLAIMPLQIHD